MHCLYLSMWSTQCSRWVGQDCVYSDVCTTECRFWMYAQPSASFHMGARLGCGARIGRDACAHGRVHGSAVTHSSAVRDGSAVRDAWLGYSLCTAWSGRMCAWTRPRFGRDTRIGCARAKFLWTIEPCGWIIQTVTCNLKVKDMQLKGSMQKNIAGKRINKGYICSLPSSLVFFTQFYSLLLAN